MRRTLVSALLFTLATACGAGKPPAELRDARAAYDAASKGPAAQEDLVALHSARVALDKAERSYADNGDTQVTRDLSYVALRRSQIADAAGRTNASLRQQQTAAIEIQTLERNRLANAQTELQTTKQSLAKTQEQLESERRARAEADKRMQEAMTDLKKFASIKHDERGTVITLTGSVLFATNQAKLLPNAVSRVDEVAEVLKRGDPSTKITIEGYTDSRGTREHNMDLSERRAETVKDQLVSRGVPSDRIKAVGKGPDDPVASNKSPEGRANNRRVEIIVSPPEGQQNQQNQPNQPNQPMHHRGGGNTPDNTTPTR